jgi:hypothetical protein
MDQKGYTLLGNDKNTIKEGIENALKNHVKYLIITDEVLSKDSTISIYTRNKIGSFKNISIFKL